ncbi:MAG: carbonic anhydrase family protein [Myxococcota bacterium]
MIGWLAAAAMAGGEAADRHTDAHAPAKPAASSSKSKSTSSSKAKVVEHAAPHWTYEGDEGPSHWGELAPEFETCSSGHAQTPIDLNTRYAESVGLDDAVFHYHPVPAKIVNNGHTIQVNLEVGNAIEIDSTYYELVQFHLHTPSEHRVNGKPYPMELHLVHKDAAGHLAVMGVFVTEGEENQALASVFDNMSGKVAQEKALSDAYDPAAILPEDHRFFRYTGSLTTPPCSEDVRWMVLGASISASAEQIEKFHGLFENNARPVQALNGRTVLVDATP